jgi:hypothetical protein
MAGPGEYSVTLRLVGQFLDQQRACDVEVVDHGAYLTASWRASSGEREERTYRNFEFNELLQEARKARGQVDRPALLDLPLAEALRALGAECDEAGAELLSLVQNAEGYRVTGLVAGQHVSYTYRSDELRQLVAEQRARRRGPLSER